MTDRPAGSRVAALVDSLDFSTLSLAESSAHGTVAVHAE
jgi:hypothetical protein